MARSSSSLTYHRSWKPEKPIPDKKRKRPWEPSPAELKGDRGLEKAEERPRRMSYREQREIVGKLKGEVDGEEHAIYVTLGNVFWVGRHQSCDLVLDSSEVSNFHLRIYAVRTATDLSIVCVQDVSTNGFYHNSHLYSPTNSIEIGGRNFSHRSVVLRPGDTIRIPGVSTVWTYVHDTAHHIAPTQHPIDRPLPTSVLPLFTSRAPTEQITRGPWKVHNYPLGTGTYGVVHLASHREGGLQVACKTIARAKSQGVRDALKKEVRVMMALQHPNVLGILDMVEDEVQEGEDEETLPPAPGQKPALPKYRPRMHLFLELVTGGDLFSYIEKYQTLTDDEVKWIAYQLIQGLEYIHGQDVVHRDIKPENILLYTSEAYPRIVIADFGMAITFEELLSGVPEHRHDVAERHFTNCGTTPYLPPERLRAIMKGKQGLKGIGESLPGTGQERRRTLARRWFEEEVQLDVYGVGLTLFTCAAGQHPYSIEQDADADGEEDEEMLPAEREQTITPAGYHREEKYHSQKGKQAWETFRQATALREESVGLGAVKKECGKYLALALEFLKMPVERWPQSNWKNYSPNAKEFLKRLISPTAAQRPTWAAMLAHPWFKKDLECRIPLFANAVSPASQVGAPVKVTTYGKDKGKGKGKAVVRKPAKEPLFLSMSTQPSQPSQPSQTYPDQSIIDSYTEPPVRNGFTGRGRKALIEDDCESIHTFTESPAPSMASSSRPGLDDLMRYGSTPRNLFSAGGRTGNGAMAGPGPRSKKNIMYRRPSQAFKMQRKESLMDQIHEDDEEGEEDADGEEDVDMDVNGGGGGEGEMSIDD